jgi:hypothetical protein
MRKLEMTNTGRRTKSPSKKFKELAKTKERGILSLGRVNCLISWAFSTIELVVSVKEEEKNKKGRRPERIKRGKSSIFILKTSWKTKLKTNIKINGIKIAQLIPRMEFT